jgi:hypothetical protein
MTKIAGSGSISQRQGSADPDPDPPQNVMDPQQWPRQYLNFWLTCGLPGSVAPVESGYE